MKARLLSTSLGALVAFAAGCGGGPPAETASAPMLFASGTQGRGASVVPDAAIARVLAREIGTDPATATERIGVDSTGGVVTLQGVVSNRLAAKRALEIAPVVRGVRAVVDRITVADDHRPDYEVDFAVAARLAKDPAIETEPISPVTHEGFVSLTGDVGSVAASRIAVDDVLAVPGVKGVADELSVVPGPRSDETLKRQARCTVHADPWLDASHVDVSAQNGALVLRGWVGGAVEWARVESDVRLTTPHDVDATALRIDQWTNDGTLRAEPRPPPPDHLLMQALADAYVRDPRVHPFVPGVDVHDGAIVLTGVAPSPSAAAAAVDDARNVPGALEVQNDIQLRSTEHPGDLAIETELNAALRRDPHLGTQPLTFEVVHGSILLRGTVQTEQDRFEAMALAASIAGAHEIYDALSLEPAAGRNIGRAEMQPK